MNNFFNRFSTKEQTFFAKRLSFLIRAGIPLIESLRMVKKQTSSSRKAKIFDRIIKDVENGQYLSASLKKFKNLFGDFTVNIIHAGEVGGILHQNLNYLAEELKKKYTLKRKVIGTLLYPAFIILATFVVITLIIIFIFPKILPIFSVLKVNLPITTRILIGVSEFLIHSGWLFLIGIAVFAVIFYILFRKIKRFHVFINRLILRLPLIGSLAQGYAIANFSRTLGLLLKSGVRVMEAINIVADTAENLLYKQELKKLAESVGKGKKIHACLEKNPLLFPEIVPQMIAIGETAGNLAETLLYLSEMFESEIDEQTKNLSGALEPALMIFMGLLVGFIAISIITPIYEITQGLTPHF